MLFHQLTDTTSKSVSQESVPSQHGAAEL